MRWMLGALLTAGLMGCYASGGVYVRRPAVTYSAGYNAGYSQTTYVQPAQPAAQPVYVQQAQPAYAQPAQPAPPPPVQCVCRQGAVEVCNGCDDNCNGAVDENCVH